jgi:hypothetical protein
MDITRKALSRGLIVIVPLLALEQLVASILIAPKRHPSSSRNTTDHAMLGLQLYLGGIGIQEVVVVYTLALAIILLRKSKDRENQSARRMTMDPWTKQRSISYALIFSLVALSTRIAYRLVELSGIFTGYLHFLAHNEVFFYTLECLPVLAALGVWTVVNTDALLDEHGSRSSSVAAYDYHELRGA